MADVLAPIPHICRYHRARVSAFAFQTEQIEPFIVSRSLAPLLLLSAREEREQAGEVGVRTRATLLRLRNEVEVEFDEGWMKTRE